MLKKLLFGVILGFFSGLHAQQITTPYKTIKIPVSRDTIHLEKTSINSSFFKVSDTRANVVDSTFYFVNFQKGTIIFKENFPKSIDSISINYLKFPDYLTKEYAIYDDSRVVNNDSGENNLYKVSNDAAKKFVPFDGLNTSGSITRGVTIGNNQNAVVNSNLDLQITGKISDRVSLRASI